MSAFLAAPSLLVCLVGSQDQTSGDQPINLKPCRLRFQLALGTMITRVLQIVLESSRILYTRGSNETDPASRTKFHHPIPIWRLLVLRLDSCHNKPQHPNRPTPLQVVFSVRNLILNSLNLSLDSHR